MSIRYYILFIVALLYISCKDNDKVFEEKDYPHFKSSSPVDGATNISTDAVITITFDEVVKLASPHGITINGSNATATVLLTVVTLSVELEPDTQYTILVPAGAVINTKGLALKEEVELSFTTRPPVEDIIKETLVASNPSPEAVNVYNFLKEMYGSKIISGTMANVSWNTNEAQWVYAHTGKYPALNGFDLIHLYASPANWINYEDISVVQNWWNTNGLVTLMWHWNVPITQGSSSYAFYTRETTFNISNAVQEGTWENGIIKADMAKAAVTLKLLRDANIPVLWRPLHEAAGRWFWWGAEGAEPCKALWRMMFDYFESEELNNLIWVWTAEPNDEAWYPGDDYVDIAARDLYKENNASAIFTEFTYLQVRFPDKIVGLGECGSVENISVQWGDGAKWSFFMTWYDYNRTVNTSGAAFESTEHQHATATWWSNTLSSSAVITRDQMPTLK